MKYILLVIFCIFVMGCECADCNHKTLQNTKSALNLTDEFCGNSIADPCVKDAECIQTGCSGQTCQSIHSSYMETICDFKECQVAKNFNLECKCIDNKCQWS